MSNYPQQMPPQAAQAAQPQAVPMPQQAMPPQAAPQPAAPQHPVGPSINQAPAYPQPGYGPPAGYPQQGPPPMQPGWNGQPLQQGHQEHWILTIGGAPEMHLGFIKESFPRGSVITHDVVNNRLIINSRVFYDTRDLDLLKSQSRKNPGRPWVIPWSQELEDEIKGGGAYQPQISPNVHDPRDHSMPIVQDDSTAREPIDISHTKVAANNAQQRAQNRQRVAHGPMPVIRGDETVEERLARLAGKGDPKSIAERERLKRERWTPQIVRDDSLGMGTGSGEISMNAGQPLPSREDAARNAEAAAAEAAARKRSADMRRGFGAPQAPQQAYPQPTPQQTQMADVDPSLYDEVAPGFEAPLPADQQFVPPAGPAPEPTAADARMDMLEGQVGQMAENMGNMMQMMQSMMQAQHGSAPAPAAPAAPAELERTPVTDPAAVAAVEAAAGQEG